MVVSRGKVFAVLTTFVVLLVVVIALANSGGDKPYPQVIEKDVIKEIPVAPNASTYYDQGNYYLYNQNYDLAIEKYNNAIRLDPDDAYFHNARAWTYALMGKYHESLTDANKSLHLRPGISNHLDTRGWAYVGLGKYDLAIQDFNDAIELRPDKANFFDRRGVAYYRWGQYQAAIEDFSKAIDMDPLFAMAHYDRSLAYAAIGNSASAEKDINQGCLLIEQEAAHNEFLGGGRDLDCNHTVGGGWTALTTPKPTDTPRPIDTPKPTNTPRPTPTNVPPTLQPLTTSTKDTFALGSTTDDVIAIQGHPTSINRGGYWHYDASTVEFDANNRVKAWSDQSRILKLPVIAPSTTSTFWIGSTMDEVLAAQGTPGILSVPLQGQKGGSWYWGRGSLSIVSFDDDNLVKEWDDPRGRLQISTATSSTASTFGLGSTKDEVLAAQGAPNAISDNRLGEKWSYGSSLLNYSEVEFGDDDRVIGWSTGSVALKLK